MSETEDIYHPQVGDTEAILDELRDMIANAGTLPLSSSPRVNRDEVLALLDEARGAIPLEIREARWILNERDEVVDRGRKESDDIIASAQRRAASLVAKTEVVRQSQRRARSSHSACSQHCLKRFLADLLCGIASSASGSALVGLRGCRRTSDRPIRRAF